MKKSILLIGITLFFILILTILFIMLRKNQKSESQVFDNNRNPDIGKTVNRDGQEEIINSTNSANTAPFTLSNIEPKEDITLEFSEITTVKFTFNKNIDPQKVFITASPETKIMITTSGNTISVSPEVTWPEGTNTITLQAETSSFDGQNLDKEIRYSFKVLLPEGL